MTVSSHQPSKAKQVFMHAVELASEVERAQYLEGACAGDPQLRQLVEEMVVVASRTSPLDLVTSDLTPALRPFDATPPDIEQVGWVKRSATHRRRWVPLTLHPPYKTR